VKTDFALFPVSASTIASHVDTVMIALLVICGAITVLVFGLILILGIRYRRGSLYTRELRPKNGNFLEWSWTFATFGVFLGLFVWGARIYFRMHVAPAGALEVSVLAKQWMWSFQHPDGAKELNELHIPLSQPVLLTMTSQDVIHSFFVPAFRIKQDVLPGRYTQVWFEANKPGAYHLFCTQYCGTAHADMTGKIIVQTQADYERWLAGVSGRSAGQRVELRPLSPIVLGEHLFKKLACITCHVEGRGTVAPDLSHIFGTMAQLNNGTSVKVDETYVRAHILDPGAWLVRGYDPVMPSFRGQVSEEDIMNLIAYIKSLGQESKPK